MANFWNWFKGAFGIGTQSSLINKISGGHLTGAEQEANAFNANEAEKQRSWEEQMSNTEYQRSVVDMQAAGVNPALAMSNGGASTPSGASASSVSPESGSSLGEILQLLSFGKDMQVKDAEIRNIESDSANKDADTANISAHTDLLGREFELKLRDMDNKERQTYLEEVRTEISRSLTDAQIEKMSVEMKSLEQHIKESEQNVKESVSRVNLNAANAALARAEVQQIVTLLPYTVALRDAQTMTEWKQAAFLGVQTAYQYDLIDAGYIDEMVRKVANEADIAGYEADSANVDALISKMHYAMRTGEYLDESGLDGAAKKIANLVLRGFSGFVDEFSPLIPVLSAGVLGQASVRASSINASAASRVRSTAVPRR